MSTVSDFIIATTPSLPGFSVKKALGVSSGLTARTRGSGGKFVAGLQSLAGREASAFTLEMEKARVALQRLKDNAAHLGANAVIGIDVETTEIFQRTMLVSAAGTPVILEPQ